MRDATLCFLIKKENGKISQVCLALKKRGFGAGRWNGAGGKVEAERGETVEEALVREVREEIGVEIASCKKSAELVFIFENNPAWDQKVHVYLCEVWRGEISESEEMQPQWFAADELPFDAMWPDDPFWLPAVLAEKSVQGRFVFGENDAILEKEVRIV